MAGEMDPRLLLGLGGPDSRFTAPASISEGSDVVSFFFLHSSPKGRQLVSGPPFFQSPQLPWEISTTPRASAPTSVMINPNSVSPSLTSSLSNRLITKSLLDISISSSYISKHNVSQIKMFSPVFKPDISHPTSHILNLSLKLYLSLHPAYSTPTVPF